MILPAQKKKKKAFKPPVIQSSCPIIQKIIVVYEINDHISYDFLSLGREQTTFFILSPVTFLEINIWLHLQFTSVLDC
jgi:hypothetical protein